MVNWIH